MTLLNKNNKLWSKELQVLSGLAILFVVTMHINAIYIITVLNLNTYLYAPFIIKLLNNLIIVAVPLFIFISGFKFAMRDTKTPYKQYVLRKFSKVIIPFVIFSSIFVIRDFILNHRNMSLSYLKTTIINELIGYNVAYHLWYIPMFIFLIFTYPLIYKLLKNDKIRVIFVMFIAVIQELLSFKFQFLRSRPFTFVYYYIFFELGILSYKYDIKTKFKKVDKYIIILSLILSIFFAFTSNAIIDEILVSYVLQPISTIAYYLLSIRIKDNLTLQYLGKYSFYIYILHAPSINNYLTGKFPPLGTYTSILYMFLLTILNILITLVVYKILEKTSLLKILFYSFNMKKKLKINETTSSYSTM